MANKRTKKANPKDEKKIEITFTEKSVEDLKENHGIENAVEELIETVSDEFDIPEENVEVDIIPEENVEETPDVEPEFEFTNDPIEIEVPVEKESPPRTMENLSKRELRLFQRTGIMPK